MKTTIQTAERHHAPGISKILREVGWHEELIGESEQESEKRVERQLQVAIEDETHAAYVALHETAVVGYVLVHWLPRLFLSGPEGYVSELFVRSAERGQGIGTQLLEAVKQEARRRGCARLGLLNGRNRESYRRAFYAKHGWQERPPIVNFVYPL